MESTRGEGGSKGSFVGGCLSQGSLALFLCLEGLRNPGE
jgi:hypothetical protein